MVGDFRAEFPSDTTPVIEQAALLIRMGFYAEASERLEAVVAEGMDEMPREQLFRVERMNQTIRRYYEMEKSMCSNLKIRTTLLGKTLTECVT